MPSVAPLPVANRVTRQNIRSWLAASPKRQAEATPQGKQHQMEGDVQVIAANVPPSPVPSAPQWLHFVSGGIGACISATVTCPLEVVKTRMQSSLYNYSTTRTGAWAVSATGSALRYTAQTEGVLALWSGLGPMLMGVVPARAIYFTAYSFLKDRSAIWLNEENTWRTHLLSAGTAGLCSTTVVNPLWVVKTHMQLAKLDSEGSTKGSGPQASKPSASSSKRMPHVKSHREGPLSQARGARELSVSPSKTLSQAHGAVRLHRPSMLGVARHIWQTQGPMGFMRGWTASVAGVGETAIQFVIYEHLKKEFVDESSAWSGLQTFTASACGKFIAISISYPHEVVRTRLRQEPVNGVRVYRSFFQTIAVVAKQEGVPALYRGMTTHMLRSVPNAAILIATYEAILNIYHSLQPQAEAR